MNDGRVDRNGRFVFGGMVNISPRISKYALINMIYQIYNLFVTTIFVLFIQKQRSSVYRINIDLSVEKLYDGIICTNSICFSLNGDKMYLSDPVRGALENNDYIMEYQYGENVNSLKNGKIITKTCNGPDGACIDSDGYLWSTQNGTGKVIRYDINGNIDMIVKVPGINVTCCAFGGENLDELFITTLQPIFISGFGLNPFDSQINGNLYSVKIEGINGVKENRFLGFSV